MYTQTEYTLAYALIYALVMLGLLVVVIPRPRRNYQGDPSKKQKKRPKPRR